MKNTRIVIYKWIEGYEIERYKQYAYVRVDDWNVATAKSEDGWIEITWHDELQDAVKEQLIEAIRASYQVKITTR